ncbi:NAD-dependent epimerase/dehydratase family protein [Armatimonas sp.]|uniref:NAD-dependent epimerase/dehydratase family protein n=1 Tax=Armatimonas sp. TaxID=1872638 RepID=UPI0037538B77
MRVLYIGGTGIISSACVEESVRQEHEVFLLNRGSSKRYLPPPGVTVITGDVRGEQASLRAALVAHAPFDAIADFITFTPEDLEARLALLDGLTEQFVFISSASCYQKPPKCYLITEETPLENPHWQYSRDKIACEQLLERQSKQAYTVVRPSLTYGHANLPLVLNSWAHPWTVVERMLAGKPVIIPGDGTSLWTNTWNGDFAKGFVGLLGRSEVYGEAFHITSDEVLCWNQLFQTVADALGVAPDFVHIPSDFCMSLYPDWEGTLIGDKVNSVVLDNSKLKRFVPRYKAEVVWAEGVRRSLEWFKADPTRQTTDPEVNARQDAVIAAFRR